ncbi:hypothetical protein [Dichotomicrobium thermohalophilum]|uniref:Uncharacterized protein n=1 Tax=Dichotomicrobium thermohalophilum TaxID=933063 RepID=A0A397QB25_9HYPH|nr:hypothetical protein [Dichotomicrobium thermohalophilum]RIA55314.1 hypothetical protein BXY53_0375 [Dichotomicrobium thermohalophilum]
MQQITSVIGVIAVWLGLSVGAWWLHRLYAHRKQRRKLALANEAWMRVREAPEIFADIRAAGMAIDAADGQARTHALLSRVRDYSDYFDDVSALRAELSRALKRDDCPPLTEILNLRRDMWAAADVLLIDDPAVFGEAFSEPGSYEEFCRDAEDLLFLDAAPLKDDPIALRLSLADEDMQTFVSGVEGEIADERERERFPTLREIIAYPVSWLRAVPRGLAWGARMTARAGRALGRLAVNAGRIASAIGAALWQVVRQVPGAIAKTARGLSALIARRPSVRFPEGRAAAIGAGVRSAAKRAPAYAKAAGRGVASVRHHPAVERIAASMRRAGDRFPDQVAQGLSRAAEMARDVRARAKAATFHASGRAREFEAGELGLHYDFLVKAHSLRQRYADMLRRAPELTETGRQFIARLELEKRSERLRLGTAKLRRRARLELVRLLTLLIAVLERLRDRLADAPPQPAQTTNLLTSPLHRLFLPPPSPREAGADFPGGLRAQARSWARGWGRSARRLRDVTPEPEESGSTATEASEAEENPAAAREASSELKPKIEETREAAADNDPDEQALRRVRRLFGIRDRKKQRDSGKRRENGAAQQPRGGAHASNGKDTAEAEKQADAETGRSAKAQILPPLRGSRAGNYDETDAGARSRDSLRSRLSGIGDEDEDASVANDGAAGEQAERRRWRRWFGL